MASSYVYVTEEELFFNKRSRRARQHQKSNEIWQSSIRRYVFLLFLITKCAQYVHQNVLFTNDERVTSRHQLPTSRKIVKISKKCM